MGINILMGNNFCNNQTLHNIHCLAELCASSISYVCIACVQLLLLITISYVIYFTHIRD